MPEDTTIKSIFDYARGGPEGQEFPTYPAVYATFVQHSPNSHPPGGGQTADLVFYANGRLELSSDKKKLTGELKLWRNEHRQGTPVFFDAPAKEEEAFDDIDGKLTVAIAVSDSGQVTHQRKLKGKSIGGTPPFKLNANYTNAMYVEADGSGMTSLSFTLGLRQGG